MNQYQQYIALSRYARWLPEEQRREDWEETVRRYIDFFREKFPDKDLPWNDLGNAIHQLEDMPSMRALMTAGPALDRDNVAGFNCSYLAINRQKAFDELMYVLMCGTGVGFSCEREQINKLPTVSEEMYESNSVIVVSDSKIGWASAFRELISLLYSGKIPQWDLSKVRPAGAPLKTFGGRASGPEPLDDLFRYTVNTFNRYRGRKLDSIAVHDLVCKIAEIVVVGGVRRSALISLSDLDDVYMRKCKSPFKVLEYTLLDQLENGDRKYSVIVDDAPYGERSIIVVLNDWDSGKLQKDHTLDWYYVHPERALANNSAVYEEKPDIATFMHEWLSLMESNSGERGIFSR